MQCIELQNIETEKKSKRCRLYSILLMEIKCMELLNILTESTMLLKYEILWKSKGCMLWKESPILLGIKSFENQSTAGSGVFTSCWLQNAAVVSSDIILQSLADCPESFFVGNTHHAVKLSSLLCEQCDTVYKVCMLLSECKTNSRTIGYSYK